MPKLSFRIFVFATVILTTCSCIEDVATLQKALIGHVSYLPSSTELLREETAKMKICEAYGVSNKL